MFCPECGQRCEDTDSCSTCGNDVLTSCDEGPSPYAHVPRQMKRRITEKNESEEQAGISCETKIRKLGQAMVARKVAGPSPYAHVPRQMKRRITEKNESEEPAGINREIRIGELELQAMRSMDLEQKKEAFQRLISSLSIGESIALHKWLTGINREIRIEELELQAMRAMDLEQKKEAFQRLISSLSMEESIALHKWLTGISRETEIRELELQAMRAGELKRKKDLEGPSPYAHDIVPRHKK